MKHPYQKVVFPAIIIIISAGLLLVGIMIFGNNSSIKKTVENKESNPESRRILMSYVSNDAVKLSREVANEIEKIHCKTSKDDLIGIEKLAESDVKKIRDFCRLSTKDKEIILEKDIREASEKKQRASKVAAYDNSYSCWYALTYNYGIPNYADLGLSSSSCSWHDAQPMACRSEGSVACLWGCNNIDHNIGWHEKWFSSTTALENEILPKGYAKISDNYGGDYSKPIGYGYRWQIHPAGGGKWHNEGPEPNPAFNWYAYLRGWWPLEAYYWHNSC